MYYVDIHNGRFYWPLLVIIIIFWIASLYVVFWFMSLCHMHLTNCTIWNLVQAFYKKVNSREFKTCITKHHHCCSWVFSPFNYSRLWTYDYYAFILRSLFWSRIYHDIPSCSIDVEKALPKHYVQGLNISPTTTV